MLLQEFFAAKRYSGADRIYVAPYIPSIMLNNALDSYGLNEDPASIRVLIDDTVFGSGKEGALIAEDFFGFKEVFSDMEPYEFKDVKKLEAKGAKVHVDGEAVTTMSVVDKKNLQHFFALLDEWREVVRTGGAIAPGEAKGPAELSEQQVQRVVQNVVTAAQRLAPERVFVKPNIPPKKLQGALASYGGTLSADDVLILIDDTLFGGAKEGMLFGRETFAMKVLMSSPRLFFWRHAETLNLTKRDLHINGHKIGALTQVGEKEIGPFLLAINAALEAARAGNASVAPVESAHTATDEIEALTFIKPLILEQPTPVRTVTAQPEKITPEKAVATPAISGTKDKLLDYIAGAIEQNKSKIIPFLKEKTGEASLAALRNDENIEKLAGILYAFLPGFVRLALKEQVFVKFVLENRNKILDKLLQEEAETFATLAAPMPVAMLGFDNQLNDLLDDAPPPLVADGAAAIAKMQSISQALQAELTDDAEVLFSLPIQCLDAVLTKAQKLADQPQAEVESHIMFALSFMYGFSYHKIPEQMRQDNVFEAFFTGFLMVCDKYLELPGAVVDVENESVPFAYSLARVTTKQDLNTMVRKILTEAEAVQQPGEFQADDIISLLREANSFATGWITGLTLPDCGRGTSASA
ncbi:hypothetical protein [Pseudomonas syringae]|uniref:hypothetical protein n=1 Tax=Pseudomonas syringae TaxID=317 RepID=UPI000EFE2C52|nr:hypothetical protein [Pseudomonas syringae]RMS24242.1 hypothetical protein ALP69_03357 [Pseudomonas syringae pv. aceris]